jgi:hypothetical protein
MHNMPKRRTIRLNEEAWYKLKMAKIILRCDTWEDFFIRIIGDLPEFPIIEVSDKKMRFISFWISEDTYFKIREMMAKKHCMTYDVFLTSLAEYYIDQWKKKITGG